MEWIQGRQTFFATSDQLHLKGKKLPRAQRAAAFGWMDCMDGWGGKPLEMDGWNGFRGAKRFLPPVTNYT